MSVEKQKWLRACCFMNVNIFVKRVLLQVLNNEYHSSCCSSFDIEMLPCPIKLPIYDHERNAILVMCNIGTNTLSKEGCAL